MPMKTLKRVMVRKFETIGDLVCTALMETEANYAEIAEAARDKMGGNTSRASVRYYAAQLRKEGKAVPERPRCFEDGRTIQGRTQAV